MRFNLTLEDETGKLLEEVVKTSSAKGNKITVNDLIREAIAEKYGSVLETNKNNIHILYPKKIAGQIHHDPSYLNVLFFKYRSGTDFSEIEESYNIPKEFFDFFFMEKHDKYVFPRMIGSFAAIKVGSDDYLLKHRPRGFFSTVEDFLKKDTKEISKEELESREFTTTWRVDSKFLTNFFENP